MFIIEYLPLIRTNLYGTSVLSGYGFTHILNRSKIGRVLSRDMKGRSYWILSFKTPWPETIYVLTRFRWGAR